jgi:hypothetical protein
VGFVSFARTTGTWVTRIRTMRSSRGVSEARTRVVMSPMFDWIPQRTAGVGRISGGTPMTDDYRIYVDAN